MFLNLVNAKGNSKAMDDNGDILRKAIEEVGSQNVVQLITNNAPVCKDACGILERKHHHIFLTPSVVHGLNLAPTNMSDKEHRKKSNSLQITQFDY